MSKEQLIDFKTPIATSNQILVEGLQLGHLFLKEQLIGFKAPIATSDQILVGGRSRATSFLKGSWLVLRHLQLLEIISSSVGKGAPKASTSSIRPKQVLEQYQNQQKVNAQIIQSLRAVQGSMTSLISTLSQTLVLEATIQEIEPTQKVRHSLSYLDKYDRKNKTAYPTFKGHLYTKLRIDQVVIKGKLEQVQYTFRQLANKIVDRIFSQIKSTKQRRALLQVTAFFKQLDTTFYNPQIP